MTKLFCAIVGISGSVFSVDIDLNQSVENLKVAIKSQSDRAITVPLPKIQLYLAKKGNLWLKDDDTLDSILQSGDVTSYEKMHVSWELNKSELFESGTSLGENAIHVLVVISETQTISPSAGDRKRSASSGIAEEELLSVVKCGLKLSDTDVAAGRLLEVPKHFMGIDIYDGLYVRQEYWDLHALITENSTQTEMCAEFRYLEVPELENPFSGVFLFLKLMTERENIAFHSTGDPHIYYFTWGVENGYETSLAPQTDHLTLVYLTRTMQLVGMPTLNFTTCTCSPVHTHPTTTISPSNTVSWRI